LLKAANLSRPGACAISDFAAHKAIRKSRIAAADMEAGVGENSRNARRMVEFIEMSHVRSRGK
jgi:hypothetical protein